MNKVLSVILFFIGTVTIFAARLADLPGINRPNYLALDNQRFYIVDGCKIKIYSLETFKLEKEFGKRGEGPREFKTQAGGWGIMVLPLNDRLVVNSPGKIAFYSKKGDFIKEIVAKSPPTISRYQPIGNKYSGLSRATENTDKEYITLNLYDDKLVKIKEVFRQKLREKGIIEYPLIPPIFYVMDERLVKADPENFIVYVYDSEGKKINEIKLQYQRLELTETYRRAVHDYYRTSPLYRDQYRYIKDNIKFKTHYPAIRYLFVADHKVYVLTFKKKEGKNEIFTFNLDGELLKKSYVTINLENVLIHSPAAVKDDKIFQLVENNKTENWELHCRNLINETPGD